VLAESKLDLALLDAAVAQRETSTCARSPGERARSPAQVSSPAGTVVIDLRSRASSRAALAGRAAARLEPRRQGLQLREGQHVPAAIRLSAHWRLMRGSASFRARGHDAINTQRVTERNVPS
jgi:hypothetical protein